MPCSRSSRCSTALTSSPCPAPASGSAHSCSTKAAKRSGSKSTNAHRCRPSLEVPPCQPGLLYCTTRSALDAANSRRRSMCVVRGTQLSPLIFEPVPAPKALLRGLRQEAPQELAEPRCDLPHVSLPPFRRMTLTRAGSWLIRCKPLLAV
jgi:hypothetical protein